MRLQACKEYLLLCLKSKGYKQDLVGVVWSPRVKKTYSVVFGETGFCANIARSCCCLVSSAGVRRARNVCIQFTLKRPKRPQTATQPFGTRKKSLSVESLSEDCFGARVHLYGFRETQLKQRGRHSQLCQHISQAPSRN